jgi:hypothetical protein
MDVVDSEDIFERETFGFTFKNILFMVLRIQVRTGSIEVLPCTLLLAQMCSALLNDVGK